MMLESKGILPHDATDCSALRASTILKIFKIRPNRAAFSCFYGSQSHVYSCKHESHDLLTLASYSLSKHIIQHHHERHRYDTEYNRHHINDARIFRIRIINLRQLHNHRRSR